jgi:iron complex outermembrane recepter protein
MSRMYRNFKPFLTIWAFFFLFTPISIHAQSNHLSIEKTLAREMAELSRLTFDDLMNLEITSVSKKAQKVSEAAAAIFVITNQDLRRSGVTSIPEALRMVPGFQVTRIDASKWAITSRGFNGRFANKLLVLIDGRSVYTPLFSGVLWDIQDTLLEDVERIEVIRGPGATLWGANAVNGVINIITKQAKDTQGGLVTAGAGTKERGFGSVRYGAKLNDDTCYRVYAKYFDRDSGVDGVDNWHVVRGGFRIDWEPANGNSLTLQGDIYDDKIGSRVSVASLTAPFARTLDGDRESNGLNLLTRWQHVISDTSDMTLQLYYDRIEQNTIILDEIRDTFDIDFQHRFLLSERQNVIWGLGYRFISDDINNTFSMSFYPDSRDDNLFSAFVQDEIILVEDRLHLTLGSKFEYNDYTGFEIQPNARLMWTPHSQHSIWTAVSRAVRTPSRVNYDIRYNIQVFPLGSSLALNSLIGNRNFDSEELIAYELGYRVQLMDRLSLDIAAFFNDYDNLHTLEPGDYETSSSPPHLVIPYMADNKMEGETYGVELAANWQALNWWRLQAAYTYLQIQLHLAGDSECILAEKIEGESPHHQISFRSSMELFRDLEFDLWVRYADNLPSQDIGSYITLDARLSWRLFNDLELSVVGQNLLDSDHPEFLSDMLATTLTEVERSVYGKITWSF